MRRLRALAKLLAAALAAGCAVNPATGETQLMLVSESQEIAMGREADPGIVAEMGVYQDSALQASVGRLGARLAALSERPGLPWTFRLLDDPLVNAFALPGGYIYVTRGILAHFESEAELAGVLGHEIGHVTARHTASQQSKAQLAQLGLAAGTLLSRDVARYGDLLGQGLGLLFLKFSRDDESQADGLGARYMRRAGYDVRQMTKVFDMLGRVTRSSGSGIPEWLSTHPDPGNRSQRMQELVQRLPPESLGTVVNHNPYLRRLDGMVYGKDPRQGYFKGTRLLHPGLAFELTFPAGWTTVNQAQTVQAVSPKQDAVMLLSLAKEQTPEAAARVFFAQQGIAGGPARAGVIGGFPANGGRFSAQTEGGGVTGTAVFVAYGGRVFEILGYSAETAWSSYGDLLGTAIRSFAKVTDPAVLGVQPWRIQIVTADRDMSIAEFARRYPGPVSAATLALLNDVDEGAILARGELVKRVVGQPLP